MSTKKRIALFGGSFDPVHTDHLNIAIACHNNLGFDEVWMLPAYLNPFKTSQNSSVESRLAMLRILEKKYDFIKINQYEILKPRPSYTYQTVKYLTDYYGNENFEFAFIMGSDQLSDFENWNDFDKLINLIQFKVFIRDENYNREIVEKYHLEAFEFDRKGLSSTEIRNLQKLWLQIPEVNDYANYNLLYLNERLRNHMDEQRYIHSLNVGVMATRLARIHGADEKKALIAGTLHDVAKCWDIRKALMYLKKWLPELENEPQPVWHSFTGYLHLQNDWLIKDQEILQAVFNHTVGSPNMSLLDKIVFCADKVSDERDYSNVSEYRQLCYENLDAGFKVLLKEQYDRAVARNGEDNIGEMLVNTYKYYIEQNEE